VNVGSATGADMFVKQTKQYAQSALCAQAFSKKSPSFRARDRSAGGSTRPGVICPNVATMGAFFGAVGRQSGARSAQG
jgi:hypothetical protein